MTITRLTLTATLLFVSCASSWAQTTTLTFSGVREDIFSYTGAFAIADFNGDGYPDIVTNGNGDSVVVLLNDGTGHFNQGAFVSGGSSSYFVTGDFNGDGIVDVAYSYYGGVNVLLGAGNGTFRTTFSASGGYGGDIVAKDINGDGILDLVVGGYQIVYFIGNGDGSMQPGVYLSAISSPFVVADINGDGHPDILGYLYNVGVGTEINNGAGLFTQGPSITLPAGTSGPIALAAGDIDGNGSVDLAVSLNNPNEIAIYTGNNTGAFNEVGTIPLSFSSNNIALLDANADGKLDLFYDKTANSHYPSTNLAVVLGNGNGTFGPPTNIATAGAIYRIVLSDLRKSGNLDLVVGGSGDISVLPNKGGGVFTQGSYETLTGVLQNSVSSDFNHDGIRDLLVTVRLSAPTSSIKTDTNSQFAGAYVLLGTGNPASPFTTGQRLFIPPDVLNVAVGDFNKDGSPDLAFVTGQQLEIFLGNGDGTFTSKALYPCTCTTLAVGDFNDDHVTDIATNGVFLFLGKGDGTFGAPLLPFVASGNYIAATDLNKDGKADLIVTASNGSGTFYTALGNGDGTFTVASVGTPQGFLAGVIADFNGDGVPDLAEWTNYNIYIYLNDGTGVFTQKSSISYYNDSRANTIAAADFNADSKIDLVVPGLGFEVFTGNGDGTFGPGQSLDAANYPNVVVAADFYDFNSGKLPDIIGVGQNGAISFLFDEN